MASNSGLPKIAKPVKRKLNKKSYSVEYTKQHTCVHYYNDGRVTLNYSIDVVVELPKKLAKALTKQRDAVASR